MKTEIRTITPEIARSWLSRNENNRTLRTNHVETLRQSFERGEYVMTHQGIAFDTTGNLLDGQHRLTALSQMPDDFSIRMLVTSGLERDSAFAVIDGTAAKRSHADVLRVDQHVASTANFLARCYKGMTTGITASYLIPFLEFVRPELDELVGFCGGSAKTWSSSPVKAAAVLTMKDGDKDYVKLVYAALVHSDFDAMPRIARALYRAALAGTVRASADRDLYARCLKVFDPARANDTRIQINTTAQSMTELRERLDRDVFGVGKKKAPAPKRGANGNAYRGNGTAVDPRTGHLL